jgi:diguanylate cyclase (GGDEF)-like protein/PAS domain S-box-containing protein
MSVEPTASTGTGSTYLHWALIPITPALGCALLTGGTTGLLPPLIALAAAVATSTAVHSALLVRLALITHFRGRAATDRPAPPSCRGAGLLGMSLLVTGATVVGAVATRPGLATAPSPTVAADPFLDPFAARLCAAGLLVAALLFVLGLLLLPGTAPAPLARLRQASDGLAIGVSLLYSAWLMVLRPAGGAHGLAVGVALIGCAGLATAIVTGMRAVRYRPAVLACCSGAVLSMTGLCATVTLFEGNASAGWLPLAALALVFGPVLCWAGALDTTARHWGPATALPARTEPGFASYPTLAVPVGAALAATGYRLVDGPPLGGVAVGLGLGVLVTVAVREFLAVLDIRGFARRIAAQEARFRSLIAGSADITLVLDDDLVVTWQSPAAVRQFALSDPEVLDRPLAALVHPDDAAAVRERLAAVLAGPPGAGTAPRLLSARLRDGSGRWRDTESTVSDQRAVPEVGALVLHVRDVGERRELERTQQVAAFTDPVTGLANRRQLMRTITAMRAVPGRPGALLLIDVDGVAGAGGGRETADAVLVEVAGRLREILGPSDLPARVSAVEFAIATARHAFLAYTLADRVLTELHRPYQLPGATVALTAAVGLAELAGASGVADTLARAGLALRSAKQLRLGRIEWYDEALEAAQLRRSALEEELPGVVARGELDLVFQPIVDLLEEVPVGAEALLRWRHPRRGTVLAADFVPVAEDLGLIDEIGEWVLHSACRQLAEWLRDGLDLWLSINLAARQLAAPNLVSRIGRALDSYHIPAERLVLEVTEQGLGPDLQNAVAALTGLRTLGVRTALARFGTGTTPLASLRRLPVDVLKVDRTLFIEPAGQAPPLIDVVVGLGRRLGLEIIAEGLEDEVHLDLVRTGGCRYGQGFLFGRPEPAEHFEAYLESHRPAAT